MKNTDNKDSVCSKTFCYQFLVMALLLVLLAVMIVVQVFVFEDDYYSIRWYIVSVAISLFLITCLPPLTFDECCYKYNLPAQQSLIQDAEQLFFGLLSTEQAKQQKHEFFLVFFAFFYIF